MFKHLKKSALFLLCVTLIVPGFSHPCAAQSEEEMQLLQMFYHEDDLVVTATRHPKPISHVAENITVVTADEIETMNAHTVAEVLNRVTGLFVNFNQDFGAPSLIRVQGSEPRHVLVLLDGVTWNFLAEGSAETNSIPVGIIERIEIIKGPASSAWGSSLGGVVNIITKPVGDSKRPGGEVSVAYGERDTQDYRAQIAGAAGRLGYYLYAGRQDSDGLRAQRGFENTSLYSKLNLAVSKAVNVGMSLGYSEPENDFGDFPAQDVRASGDIRTVFGTLRLDADLTRELSLNLSAYAFNQKFTQTTEALGLGMSGAPGERFLQTEFDEETLSAEGKLNWVHGIHTAVLGVEIDNGDLEQTLQTGSLLQMAGAPQASRTTPDMHSWAVYLNDTISFGRWSLTPGIRFDDNNITGSFISPSLGAACRLADHTVLRAAAARGFTVPPLLSTSGGGLFLDPNPDLEPEEVWSYQAGVESAAARYLWLKATLFYHDVDDALAIDPLAAGPPTFNDLAVNQGDIRRRGIDVEAETVPLYNFSLSAGFAYVDIDPADEGGSDELYTYNVGLDYNDRKSFRAQLFGHYVWWDLDQKFKARYDDFIWDLNLNKAIYATPSSTAEIFFTAHNLFNGRQYTNGDSQNPQRWIEAGLRFRF